jgi:hypothetical protein
MRKREKGRRKRERERERERDVVLIYNNSSLLFSSFLYSMITARWDMRIPENKTTPPL